jgi:hypothetical protein
MKTFYNNNLFEFMEGIKVHILDVRKENHCENNMQILTTKGPFLTVSTTLAFPTFFPYIKTIL